MDSNSVLQEAKNDFAKSLDYLNSEFAKVQAGKASPAILEDVSVEAYGMTQPLKSLAVIAPNSDMSVNFNAIFVHLNHSSKFEYIVCCSTCIIRCLNL